ncbi:MAG: hypothetical protein AMXMBFR34_08100 [Myxococcaceae bacterium]
MSIENPVAVPINPFVALKPHFGMLLGVDELATLQGFASGKLRLHNAWLHRAGTVWGLAVEMKDQRELRVRPGLAIDGLGRELHLAAARCLDVARWYQLMREELALDDAAIGGRVTFNGQVALHYAGCFDSPVPGITEGCSTSSSPLRYSRLREEVDVRLERASSTPPSAPYRALRVLFGLEAPVSPGDDALLLARAAALALPPAQRPAALAQLLRDWAAEDAMKLAPNGSGWPGTEGVVLASVQFELQRVAEDEEDNAWKLLDATALPPAAPVIDNHVRATLVATHSLQELLCGAATQGAAADAGGARFDASNVALAGDTLTLVATQAVTEKSAKTGFTVARYDDTNGWAAVPVTSVTVTSGVNLAVKLTLPGSLPAGTWLRVVVAGTGATPVLTQGSLVPIGGAVGGPAGSAVQGNDFIHFWKVS